MAQELNDILDKKNIQALIFDLDGVVTQTAKVHAQAWKQMFDTFLVERGIAYNTTYKPLEVETDYKQLIDGIPRYDGVRNFLNSRNISLPEGSPQDEPGWATIYGLGKKKNILFQDLIRNGGVEVYHNTVQWIKFQQSKGRKTAVISASKNCETMLAAANLLSLFKVRVEGKVSEELNLKGKPAPDIFLEAAKRLKVPPKQTAIFEDAQLGVKAGRAGGFGLVVGVDRTTNNSSLLKHGADILIEKFPQ